MKIYDVTSSIYEGMPVYKNNLNRQPQVTTETDGHVTESRICLDVHTGTHVDAPLHMINNGKTIESIQIEELVRPCKVFDLTTVNEKITKQDLEKITIEKDDFIILKTKNSFDTKFNFQFVYVEEKAANYLVEKEIAGVGIDSLGIERDQEGDPTHKTLMSNGIIIMEGLRLKEVEAGDYFMVAAPLKIVGTDGAPARVLLLDQQNE